MTAFSFMQIGTLRISFAPPFSRRSIASVCHSTKRIDKPDMSISEYLKPW